MGIDLGVTCDDCGSTITDDETYCSSCMIYANDELEDKDIEIKELLKRIEEYETFIDEFDLYDKLNKYQVVTAL